MSFVTYNKYLLVSSVLLRFYSTPLKLRPGCKFSYCNLVYFEGTLGHSCKLTTLPAQQKNKSEQALKDSVCSVLLIVL
jgi:hypothetical protein